MKRKTILGATLLCSTALILTPLTAQAATPTAYTLSNFTCGTQSVNNRNTCDTQSVISGNVCESQRIFIGNSCNSIVNGAIQLQGFGNCVIPVITLPPFNCPNQNTITPPDCNDQNPDLPDNEAPDTDAPETDSPIIPEPEVPSIPEENKPETNKPEGNKPGTDNPEGNKPETDQPENNIPNDEGTNTPSDDNSESGDTEQHSFMKQVVSLVNIERAKYGLAPLTIDVNMEQAALIRSREIQKSFSHNRPDGSSFSTVLKETGVSYNRSGENIAWGQKTPAEVVNAWMNSSGHRANILSTSFTRIGVGYTQNQTGTGYWVQLFAN